MVLKCWRHKGAPVHSYLAAEQGAKVDGAGGVWGRQHGQVEFPGQLKPRGRMGVHALAQNRRRRHAIDIQRTGKEAVTPELFDRIEVVLALHQHAQVGLQDSAVGGAADTDQNVRSTR